LVIHVIPAILACQVCPQERTLGPGTALGSGAAIYALMSTRPTLRERHHRGLARRLLAVRRRAVFVVLEGERPHPRAYRHSRTFTIWPSYRAPSIGST